MSGVTVDASVWIAAQDATDPFSASSRAFLLKILTIDEPIHVPAYARVEVACALARKLRNALKGQKLTDGALTTADVWEVPMDDTLMASAFNLGTATFLRG
ncbi:MAG: Ribonuclease VapC, partial [Verrucomicrobiaceae bacterium]|nr:Ribonuclease VapC [Verrucomicrobiaceae bacterium]